MDPALAQQVLDAKAQAERNRTRINHLSLRGLAVGLAIAILWFLLDPSGSPEPDSKILIGVMIGIMIPRIVILYRPSRFINPPSAPVAAMTGKSGKEILCRSPNICPLGTNALAAAS